MTDNPLAPTQTPDPEKSKLGKILPGVMKRFTNEEPKSAETVTSAPVSATGAIVLGLGIVLTTFFGAGVWAATAPLASSINAPGTVVFAGKRRSIQHLEGGIVESLHVLEGQKVDAGDILISLDGTQAEATAARLRNQLDTQTALQARLLAEQYNEDTVTFPADLLERSDDPKVEKILEGQRQEFDERRKTLVGTVDLLNQKIDQLKRTIEGMEAQKASKSEQAALTQDELEGLASLLAKGLTNKSRVIELQRNVAQLNGDVGDITSQIGRAQQQISEAEMQVIQTRQQFREEVVGQLREAESKGSDLQQQLFVAEDVLGRLDIRAPQSGTVQNLAVTTIGGVITPGEVLMEIAPEEGDFLVEAQVSPLDIDSVTIGQTAEVRFSALDLRTTPVIIGTVTSRSGDRIEQSNRPPYFRVQVETPPEEMRKLSGRELQAGMPAEVLIQTSERTLLNYLTKPLTDQLVRGMNEQ
ncbi:HlyD family type I secretion periplasmic adaptor subunit [Fulvimarina sp. 2208YS6-2-32]|uniref:Membrane fusion protein (MFP) family protein n=1 Tax=Fulvimarina uroteuthidis TaxID=3098149 RepID=A0ABU5I250_9HYPH|nr:HlyD family type I secretion periplasmic adaptor subunit [Fulvimarina sp. 2208YS6-2-32]MDY8108848.1 HlyD family type I secretion periplasmic adaptor subunit [Fulvimarina sp. 2208YS6-2-32]